MPVVDGLVDQQQRLLARREEHERIGGVAERCPHLERRLRAEGQVVIVEEQQRRCAGVQQQGVVPGRGERGRAAVLTTSRCEANRPDQESVFCLMAGELMAGILFGPRRCNSLMQRNNCPFLAWNASPAPPIRRRLCTLPRCCRQTRTKFVDVSNVSGTG